LAFEVDDVHYAYPDAPALRGLSLTIAQGQRVALLGANGSGKSTLLRLLDALYFADRGRISAFGEVVSQQRMQDDETAFAFRRQVGFVFQNPDVQLFNPTVFDELAFGPLQLGWAKDEIRQRVAETLKAFSIEHLKDRSPYRLSGGEKKRVAIASALILEPKVMLLDEPTAGLDPQSASEVVNLLVRSRGTGRTVVTATHDLDIVEDIADWCFVLQAGRVVASGAPADILQDAEVFRLSGLAHTHQHVRADAAARHHRHPHRDPSEPGDGEDPAGGISA
jgi:cobalt/nickel transport system ATP-binding protein